MSYSGAPRSRTTVGRVRDDRGPYDRATIDAILDEGFVCLEDPEIHRQHRDTVVWNRVDKLRGFGGIRIEDNVLIRDGGNEVLTRAIPKE